MREGTSCFTCPTAQILLRLIHPSEKSVLSLPNSWHKQSNSSRKFKWFAVEIHLLKIIMVSKCYAYEFHMLRWLGRIQIRTWVFGVKNPHQPRLRYFLFHFFNWPARSKGEDILEGALNTQFTHYLFHLLLILYSTQYPYSLTHHC